MLPALYNQMHNVTFIWYNGTTSFKRIQHMKEITLKVPDQKVDFVLELIKQLGLEVSEDIEFPKDHKENIREHNQKSKDNPDFIINWDEEKDDFKRD